MRIAVFGGSGRTGQRIIDLALAGGHAITTLARDPGKLGALAARCRVVPGDVLDPAAVARTLEGADAVLSALGNPLGSGSTARSEGMRHIVAAMEARGIRRIIAIAGGGILDAPEGGLRADRPSFPPIFKPGNLEHQAAWQALRASTLDWTLACTPDLVPGHRTDRYRALADMMPEGGRRISLDDVASFMLRELTSTAFSRRRVGLAD